MSDLVFEAEGTKLLATEKGFMVRQPRRERWVHWDVFFNDSDKIEKLEAQNKKLREALPIFKELIDNCQASIAEENVSGARIEYRKQLYAEARAVLAEIERSNVTQ